VRQAGKLVGHSASASLNTSAICASWVASASLSAALVWSSSASSLALIDLPRLDRGALLESATELPGQIGAVVVHGVALHALINS
jgi:hypothetical protein